MVLRLIDIVLIWSTTPAAQKLIPPSHNPPMIARLHFCKRTRRLRRVPRLKKNPAASPINTMVVKGAASPNRNQAIIHGGTEIEISLIVAAGYA
jgi:hypothetical protein